MDGIRALNRIEHEIQRRDFRPESVGEDFDPEDHLEDEGRYGAISDLDLGAIDYSVAFPDELLP